MALETRFDLLTLLRRRKESFPDWLERMNIRSYSALLARLDDMDARTVEKADYDAAAKVLRERRAATRTKAPAPKPVKKSKKPRKRPRHEEEDSHLPPVSGSDA